MNFSQLHERLRVELLRRIERGSLTAALLARQTGMQPSHLSNFLRSKRGLSLPALDRVLAALGLSVADLLPLAPAPQFASPLSIPLASDQAAMYEDQLRPASITGYIQLPTITLNTMRGDHGARRPKRERFVAITLTAAQAQPMRPVLHENSVVVLDRHSNLPSPPSAATRHMHAVRLGTALHLCYLTYDQNCLVLRPHALEHPVQLLPVPPQSSPADFIIGRVCVLVTNL